MNGFCIRGLSSSNWGIGGISSSIGGITDGPAVTVGNSMLESELRRKAASSSNVLSYPDAAAASPKVGPAWRG
jgi:hypothetical protein